MVLYTIDPPVMDTTVYHIFKDKSSDNERKKWEEQLIVSPVG